ncbi:MAG: hypothetical protein IPH18_12910 [Chitinophagaceae bacterium]|nr:hypothetical protein [Chitinophagaceae bacterium]MBK8951414.1 hypothetical protein [Chitinophagaceae bacterium]
MRVKQIRTESDAIRFVNEWCSKDKIENLNISFSKFGDSNYYFNADSNVLKYVKEQKKPNWIKKDFNQDGRKDFIFCGFINNSPKVIGFISDKNKYRIQSLISDFNDDAIPIIGFHKKKKYVEIILIDAWARPADTEFNILERIRRDTIVYKENRFVALNYAKLLSPIDTIKVNYIVSIKPIREEIIITNNAVYLSRMEVVPDSLYFQQNLYKLDVSSKSITDIMIFCSKLPTYGYKEFYSPIGDVFDGFFWQTTFVYKDGSVKKIFDRLGTGPLELIELYKRCEALRKEKDRVFIGRIR